MKKLIKLLCILIISIGVTSCRKESLITNVTILDKIDLEKIEMDTSILRNHFPRVKFQPIKVDLLNNTNSNLQYWTESCSWQSNWIPDHKSITWFVECPKNIPILVTIAPHETKSYYGIVESNDSIVVAGSDFRIGFVLVRKNEVHEEGDFIHILRYKIETKKDIYWSNSIIP